jgi:ATP synthase protein I
MKHLKAFQHILLLTQIGLNIALPVGGGVYIGAFLDKKLSTGSTFMVIGILLGVFSGIAGVYRLISQELNKKH